ncbi:ATPase [Roseovarius sp. LXJ103]|uniref:ATP12 family chaperone protein n=1 Tax=Roseovarius carneus TaxID=2853164 RepID=UPI000D620DE5|nr:ATP12 family protein [Roseovarius carneus]MBZ8118434.1 ATPase [Roseovarius carneus]PWE35862.1 ATPase [Pelagicola sp. LXJ1103]
MSEWRPKRFWETAHVAEAEGGFEVLLDTRPVRTPAKAALRVPTRAMAEAVAAEWDAQIEKVDPASMPVTRSVNAAIDKLSIQRAEVADMIAGYGDTDLLCYRAESPQELVERQASLWDPLLDWADSDLGARLRPVSGVMHTPQDVGALETLRQIVHGFDDFELTALHDLVGLSGSIVLGLAAVRGAQDIETLWDLSRLDEAWQAELWGTDDEAEEMAAIKREAFLHALRFFHLAQAR